jgi:hypothetical protein
MATIPSPVTWTTGDTVTAEAFNTEIRDNLSFFLSRPAVLVYRSSAQTSANGTNTLLVWNQTLFDTDGMHDGDDSKLIAVTAGLYEITLHVDWEPISDSNPGNRYISIMLNNSGGTTRATAAEIAADMQTVGVSDVDAPQVNHVSVLQELGVGDYVEGLACNTIGTSLDTIPGGALGNHTTYFSARWVGTA